MRKITVVKACENHTGAQARMTRREFARFACEGGMSTPCVPDAWCVVKPGTDFFAASAEHVDFVAEWAVNQPVPTA